jgi:two-component sensor histidine kinase
MLDGPDTAPDMRNVKRHVLYRRPAYVLQDVPLHDLRQMGLVGLSFIVCWLVFQLRVMINDVLPPGFPFITFFPAIILCAFVLGMWPGIFCALMGGLLSVYHFIPPDNNFDMSPSAWVAIGFYAFISIAFIVMLTIMDRTLRRADVAQMQAEQNAEFQSVMAREMNHRVKNLFGVITSIVRLSSKSSDDIASFATQLTGRISSLSHAHELVWESHGQTNVSVRDIVERIVLPIRSQSTTAFSVSGDHRLDDPHVLQVLSLMVHELATNAAKHGALSSHEGSLAIVIDTLPADGEMPQRLVLKWHERLPVVSVSMKHSKTGTGFGKELMQRLVNGIDGTYSHEMTSGKGVDVIIELPFGRKHGDAAA